MIVLGKMGHKTWMLLRLSLPIQYPQRQVLGIRGSAHRDLSGLFPGKASLILNAHTQLARLLLPFVPHILKTISPVPCIVETIFLVWLFLKAERKMWVFVGLRFPIQYPLRQVRIVSQERKISAAGCAEHCLPPHCDASKPSSLCHPAFLRHKEDAHKRS